jgi:hypothetical protein
MASAHPLNFVTESGGCISELLMRMVSLAYDFICASAQNPIIDDGNNR